MLNPQANLIARIGFAVAAALVTSASWAQQAPAKADPKEADKTVVVDEAPLRQPPTTTDESGKSVPVASEKLVLADPATKMYMPCRDANDSLSTEEAAK